MIEKVEIRNPQGDLLTLNLEEPDNGYVVNDIEGLDPVKATIVSSGFAGLDGKQFETVYREERTIVIKLDLKAELSNLSAGELRSLLYKWFMTKANVGLRFFSDILPDVEIMGIVEDFDSPRFVKEPYASITITCLLPEFYVLTSTVIPGNTVSTTTEMDIQYLGTVEVGYIFELAVDRTIDEFILYHRAPDNTLYSVNFSYDLLAGDIVRISSVSGNKYVELIRSGVSESILFAVSPESPWLELTPGENNFRAYAEGAAIPYTITYVTQFGAL